MPQNKIFKECQKKWGEELQIKVAIEECAELIKELAKFGRTINGSDSEKIAAEVADVEIMLEELKIIFKFAERVRHYKKIKLERLKILLESVQK